jgi:dipeptidase D
VIDVLSNSPAHAVWEHFVRISQVPRPSGHEERIRHHLLAIAEHNSWAAQQDETGNIVLRVPGRGTLAEALPLVLQGHMDMVCEKNADTTHDFMTDPITMLQDGDWIAADGTTLGSDNGVGVALALAVAESAIPDRVPLELLITVDEERGLTGAFQCDASMLTGRTIINLDSEEDGVFIIGCAGGTDWTISADKIARESSETGWRCTVSGLRGGHSGVDIDKKRVNAIRLAARVADQLLTEHPEAGVSEFSGGNAMNAIPRECSFVIHGCEDKIVRRVATAAVAGVMPEEAGAACDVVEAECASCAVDRALIKFLATTPNGVLAMDPNYLEHVQSSSNLGVVTDNGATLSVQFMARSTLDAERHAVRDQVRSAAGAFDGQITFGCDFPGWSPNPESKILQLGIGAYRDLFSVEPAVQSIHAGLECGIIGGKLGIDEMLSFGPTIEGAHSPAERINIKSVEQIYHLLSAVVARDC